METESRSPLSPLILPGDRQSNDLCRVLPAVSCSTLMAPVELKFTLKNIALSFSFATDDGRLEVAEPTSLSLAWRPNL